MLSSPPIEEVKDINGIVEHQAEEVQNILDTEKLIFFLTIISE